MERRPEVVKGAVQRRQRGVRGRVRERPEPEVGEGPCQEHDQTDCRERRQGAGQERYAGDEPTPRVAARAEEDVEEGEEQKGAAALFDDKGRPEERPAAQKGRDTATVGRAQEDEHACEDGRQDEVLGVGRGEQELRAERQRSERRGGDRGDPRIEQPARDQEDENDRHDADDQEPEMNARGSLAEELEDQGVDGVDARHLEVVRLGVRENALEEELSEVGVLTLVAVQGDVEQSEPDSRRGQDDEAQNPERPGASGAHGRISPARSRITRSAVGVSVVVSRGMSSRHAWPATGRLSDRRARGHRRRASFSV